MKDRFKQIREYYGLSQAQFAQRLNMSPGFISNIETGRSSVSEKTIDAVCRVFQTNREWLVGGVGEMVTQPEKNPVDKNGIAQRVKEVRKAEGLTQEQFAKRIGYSKIQVHSVEKEKVVPSNQFIEKIVCEFGVDPEWIFTGVGDVKNQGCGIDDKLMDWLYDHPEVVRELRIRGGLD